MILRHRGYGVYITVDCQQLEVFKTTAETTISCYVASEVVKVSLSMVSMVVAAVAEVPCYSSHVKAKVDGVL
jgi:hypothetical protein